MFKFLLILGLILSVASYSGQEEKLEKPWTAHILRGEIGNIFDFELGLKKGDGYPTEAMLKYGYEYGHRIYE